MVPCLTTAPHLSRARWLLCLWVLLVVLCLFLLAHDLHTAPQEAKRGSVSPPSLSLGLRHPGQQTGVAGCSCGSKGLHKSLTKDREGVNLDYVRDGGRDRERMSVCIFAWLLPSLCRGSGANSRAIRASDSVDAQTENTVGPSSRGGEEERKKTEQQQQRQLFWAKR